MRSTRISLGAPSTAASIASASRWNVRQHRCGPSESAVIRVPDPDFGERVTAVVVPQVGEVGEAGEPDEEAIITALRSMLAAYKLPRQISFVDELPRNAMGKVQKNALRERFTK